MKKDKSNGLEPEVKDLDVIFDEVSKEESDAEVQDGVQDELRNFEMPINTPYVKILDAKGDVANPITKENPFNTVFLNGKQRRDAVKKATKNPKNNKKGVRVVITNLGGGQFTKTYVRKQRIEKGFNSPTLNDDGTITPSNKFHKSRTIIHNDFKK